MKHKFKYTGLLFLSLFFLFTASINAQIKEEKRIYVKIEIMGLACPFCAFGMEKELKKVAGVDDVEIELKAGLAYISTPLNQQPTKGRLEKIITDAGFTVGKIEYSSKHFAIKESQE